MTTHAEIISAYRCLRASGMLFHYARCYDDCRAIPFAAFAQAITSQAVQLRIFSVGDEEVPAGFMAASLAPSADDAIGRIHFFVLRPDVEVGVAPALLERVLAWFESAGARQVRQMRLDPVSSVLRIEQDRYLIDLLHSNGFADGLVAANMHVDMTQFQRSEQLRAQAAAVSAAGIVLRAARAADVPAVRALNAQEGLAIWDYHVDAMLAAGATERLLVAEREGVLIGYANFTAGKWDHDPAEYGPLLVASAYRHLGLGSVLTAQALENAYAQGKRRIRLSTVRMDFYRPLGFTVSVAWQEQMTQGKE